MRDALEEHQGTINTGGCITNLLFADYIDGLDGKGEEIISLEKNLDNISNFQQKIKVGSQEVDI